MIYTVSGQYKNGFTVNLTGACNNLNPREASFLDGVFPSVCFHLCGVWYVRITEFLQLQSNVDIMAIEIKPTTPQDDPKGNIKVLKQRGKRFVITRFSKICSLEIFFRVLCYRFYKKNVGLFSFDSFYFGQLCINIQVFLLILYFY